MELLEPYWPADVPEVLPLCELDGDALDELLPEPYWLDEPELLPVCELVDDGLELEELLLPMSDWLDLLDEPVWELVSEPLDEEPYWLEGLELLLPDGLELLELELDCA